MQYPVRPSLLAETSSASLPRAEPHRVSSARNLAYAAFFTVLVPAFLYAWSVLCNDRITGPLPSRGVSIAISCCGLILLAWALVTFMAQTRKLPVNIDPPDFPVLVGPYRWLGDPIYVGFGIFAVGIAGLRGLVLGFWFAAPTLVLLTVALVLGYENGRRPPRFARPALLDWPDAAPSSAPRRAILSALAHGLIVASIVIFTCSLGEARPGDVTNLGILAFPFLILPSQMLRRHAISGRELRHYVATLYAGTAIAFTLAYGSLDGSSVVVIVAGIIAGASLRLADGSKSRFVCSGASLLLLVLLVSAVRPRPFVIGCFVIAAAASYLLPILHQAAIRISENIANSWFAIQIGPVRIINYSIYAFAAAFAGVIVFEMFARDPSGLRAVVITGFGLLGAAVWGQAIEYSGRLARPFGYFGAVIGAVIGVLIVAMFTGVPPIHLGAALALCSPWIQAIGRLRCLVQGCCHGRLAQNAAVGIRYRHKESRVVCIAELAGSPLYPTQLYSIYANIFLGVLLARLSFAGFPASLIVGTYLIVSGGMRFIEEDFRGEPQTPSYRGLKLYQWLSILQVIGGIVSTLFRSDYMTAPSVPNGWHVVWALLLGLMSAAAMGMDLPVSLRRFSRLTPG